MSTKPQLKTVDADQNCDQELEQFIQDAAAFLRFALNNNISSGQIVATLAHDIGGLSRFERCFSPRVSGYAANELNKEVEA